MLPVDPSIAAFGEKVAGFLWKEPSAQHNYVELEPLAKTKTAEDEKQAISARLVAKALERASQRAVKGEITPERLKRFAKKTERWSEGANKRVFNSVGKRTVATIPRADDASRAFVEPLRSRQIPASIASAYDKTRAKIHSRSNKPSSSPATTTIPAVKQVTLGEMLLGGNGSSGFYDTETHTVGGNFLHSPPVLFHELGHALDFGGRGTSAREERNAQKLLAESIAWRRGSQLYDTWRKSLPQENKPNELDAAEMPTTRDVLRFRDAPLETYRLKHLNNLAGQFNNAMKLNMPIVRPPMDIGPHGRVFSRTQQALRDAARYVANHEYEKHRAAEAASKPTTIEFTGEKTPIDKAAASRWREPENLVKIVKPDPRLPLMHRLDLLQHAAQKMDPSRKKPGEAYDKFYDSLQWHDIPAPVVSRSSRVVTHLSKPRYLFRGIVPHSNIVDPWQDGPTARLFVHATPYADDAKTYTDKFKSWPTSRMYDMKQPRKSVEVVQVFKPLARQNYTPDFMLDRTAGKTPKDSDWNLALRDAVRKAVQLRTLEEINGRQSSRSSLPKLRQFMWDRTYETPVTRANPRLGTFLVREKPHASDDPRTSIRQQMEEVQVARVPSTQKRKFEGMARQWNTVVNHDGTLAKHTPTLRSDKQTDALADFAREWRPAHLTTSTKVQKMVDRMMQQVKAHERRPDSSKPKRFKPLDYHSPAAAKLMTQIEKKMNLGGKKNLPAATAKPSTKKANWLSDYGYHFNKLYNPESYGFDVRTPTGRDDLRNIAVSTAVGTGIGAIRGAIWPGYIEKLDEAGRVLSKKKRGRLLGSLRDALTSGALSGISSAAGITAKKYLPEIEQALIQAKDNIVSKLPVQSRVIHEGVDTNPQAMNAIKGLA